MWTTAFPAAITVDWANFLVLRNTISINSNSRDMLICVSNVQQPELKVKDFELKCAAMTRNDVVEYIHENVYDPFTIDIN